MESQMRARASELMLSDDDVARWEPVVDDALLAVVLGSLLTFEDALLELAS